MGAFYPLTLTPEVFTGNPATVDDKFDITRPNNGARMPLGTPVYQTDSSGRRLKFRYVRLNSITPPVLVAGAPVFWKDNTFTSVTAVNAEAMAGVGGSNFAAGILLNANAVNGDFILIQTYGYNATVAAPASTVAGDALLAGSAATQTTYRVASGTAPSQEVIAVALGSVSGGSAQGLIIIEEGYGL